MAQELSCLYRNDCHNNSFKVIMFIEERLWHWRYFFQSYHVYRGNDCGTGDISFRSYHVYREMIVVLEITLSMFSCL